MPAEMPLGIYMSRQCVQHIGERTCVLILGFALVCSMASDGLMPVNRAGSGFKVLLCIYLWC